MLNFPLPDDLEVNRLAFFWGLTIVLMLTTFGSLVAMAFNVPKGRDEILYSNWVIFNAASEKKRDLLQKKLASLVSKNWFEPLIKEYDCGISDKALRSVIGKWVDTY